MQSIFVFSCIYIESLLTTLAHIRTFLLCSGLFASGGWALFAGYFELREAAVKVEVMVLVGDKEKGKE